jgi:predicted metal-dependent HD superfamily phosphohydrolase
MRPDALARRWAALVRACGVAPATAAPHLDALLAAYREPHRAYHGVEHLAHVFTELDGVPLWDPAVEWATWYHDAVYRPGRRDNERRSGALARATLERLGLERLAPRVVQLIEATRTHETGNDDLAAQLFLDADMAILGADPATYERYALAIRREHRLIPAFMFARGRRAFVRDVLARLSIFMTDHFAKRYERRARKNLQNELAQFGR